MGSNPNWTKAALAKTVEDAVAPGLQPGEEIRATLTSAMTGMSPWLVAIGAVGALIGLRSLRYYGVVVTDRRVFLVRLTSKLSWTATIESATPRADVRVVSYRSGSIYGRLVLEWSSAPGTPGQALSLSIPRRSRSGADAIVAALVTLTE